MSEAQPLSKTERQPPSREDVLAGLLNGVNQITQVICRHRQDCEINRTLSPDVVRAMRDVGLFRMKSPHEVGGAEIHPVDQMAVVEAVVKLDSAAAWTMFIGATVTGRALSALSDKAVDELLAMPDFPIMAGSLKPSGSATKVDDGFRISGRWAWGSGVQHADHVVVPVLRPDQKDLITAVVPRSQIRIIDNWQALGINGSGSCDFDLDDVFVPEHFAITTPSQRRGGAIFRMGYGFAANEHAIFALALAQQALDSFISSSQKKRGYGKGASIADREIVQRAVAESELRLRGAKLLMTDVLEHLFDASSDEEAPIALQAETRAASVLCTDEAIVIVNTLFRYAGGSAVMLDDPMQRILRDLYTAQSHLMVSDAAYEALGKLRLQLTDKAPLR
ncbi:MAG: acyl-CoA dehydrogenase family protein [Pseudomonadota bacterium]|nr:acyl-CoA dehydrogenase family protein [Pseudomonadota bacterium]